MAPKPKTLPPLQFHPSAIISDGISFSGSYPIIIGSNSVLHPRSKFNSTEGPIIVGSNCIISERTQLIAPDDEGLVLGDGVVLEVNALVHASRVEDGALVEVGVKLGTGSRIGKDCTLSPLSVVNDCEVVPQNTVIFGDQNRRVDSSDTGPARAATVEAQIACLKKLLTNRADKYANT